MPADKVSKTLFASLPVRLTALAFTLVALGVLVMASLSFMRVSDLTTQNANVRIDRAAKAAASMMEQATQGQFTALRDENLRPLALQLTDESDESALVFTPFFDALLAEIGGNNQGAANLFALNRTTLAFDRFATISRRPDGSMPPPMSITQGHPAYASLAASEPFVGEVPVMGRMRLAYLTPILDAQGALAGALAVDVGWVDDLRLASNELRSTLFGYAAMVLLLVAGFGVYFMRRALKPLRTLAQFANDVAAGNDSAEVPYMARRDEVGALAHGLARVARLQDELEDLAYTDIMTGLGNRARSMKSLEEAIEASKSGKQFALLHIDLVRFSRVNAAYGTAMGDQVLRDIGQRIQDHFGPQVPVARQGDDKFAVILEGVVSALAAQAAAQALVSTLSEPVQMPLGDVQVDAAVGVCLLPSQADDVETAIARTNLALKAAVQGDLGRTCVYSPDYSDNTHRELQMERDLRKAISRGELTLHYQPQINPTTHHLEGLEALARWTHPTEGSISPAEFIGVAERSGLIVDLGDWALNEACRQARSWLDEGFAFGHVAVNVSAVQLWRPDFASTVEAALDRHNLQGKHVCIEVTESVFADHEGDCMVTLMEKLRALGVMLSLDDFGSGYSSLGYLNKLPFDQLKIDRTFVRNAPGDDQSEKLLRAIVALGQGLGMAIVAEGAEEADEVALVEKLGVGSVQGYYFARPVGPYELGETLRSMEDRLAASAEEHALRLSA